MSSANNLLADVNLRYRNSFTAAQKLVWLNEEMRELYDVMEVESPPYAFTTVQGQNLYPLPAGFDPGKITVVSMQLTDSLADPAYQQVPMRRNDDNVAAEFAPWYTLVSDAFFLCHPGEMPAGRTVYIYCDADPDEVTEATAGNELALPSKYQELLKLGLLKRIAQARKDIVMANNYDASYQEKITDILWSQKMAEPEFIQPTSPVSFRSGRRDYTVNGW